MKWQDGVIAFCQLMFIFAMIPTLRSNHKPALATSVMNVILVGIITITLVTLKLWFATITGSGVALTWLVIAIQTTRIRNKNS